MLLKDKVVVVSGIGPGLGIELALRAAEQGAKLVVAARTPAKLDAVEKALSENCLATEILKVPTDITNVEQCDALTAAAVERFSKIDALLNNAYAFGSPTTIDEADFDDWRNTMEVNFFGSMNMSRSVATVMKQQKQGAIVNINTMVTRKPALTQAGYAASKAALTSATMHMAQEFGKYNIRVNSAFMGWMWGPPVEYYFKQLSKQTGASIEQLKANVAKNIPLGKIPTDADCAKAAIFLASDYACAITGACLDVNGGEYMAH